MSAVVIIMPGQKSDAPVDEAQRRQDVKAARAFLAMMARVTPRRSTPSLVVDNGKKV